MLAASIFHQGTYTVGEVKRRIAAAGFPMRQEEGGHEIDPDLRFDDRGLIPVVVQDVGSGAVLMLA